MTGLTRWDPFREMSTFRDMMERVFDEPFFEAPRMWTQRSGQVYPLALDVMEEEDRYVIKASIPGLDPNDVEITLTDNVLTLRGETKSETEREEQNYHLRERRFGNFSRSIRLPMPVDADQVDASHENGVLTLQLPKQESVKPKRITVKNTITASSSASNGSQSNGN
jgi:HSP20 family protein